MLQPEAIIFKRGSQNFADRHQHQHIEKNCKRIILRSAALGEITKRARPTGGEKCYQQSQSDGKIGNAQPALDAVVVARFGGIGENRCDFLGGHYSEELTLSYRVSRPWSTRNSRDRELRTPG